MGQKLNHVGNGDLDRVLPDDSEERFQIERRCPQRIRSSPGRQKLQITI
jgi:hypothetical protein